MEVPLIVLLILCTLSSFQGGANGVLHKVGLKKERHENTLGRIQSKLAKLRTMAATTNVTLKDVQDMYYYGDVNLGTPDQSFRVMFDSGSADLWLGSSSYCTGYPSYCKVHAVYDHSASSTYQQDGSPFSITYGKGEVSGIVSIDSFEVAGLKVTGQKFGEATYVDSDTANSDFDGILGLAYTDLSSMNVDPPFVTMIKQGVVDEPIFAFYLNNVGDNTSDGELVIGGTDPDHYTGDITYTPVVQETYKSSILSYGYWLITLDGIHTSTTLVSSTILAMPDSGTSFIYGPNEQINIINNALGGQVGSDGLLYVDCSSISSLGSVSFIINGAPFVLDAEDYILTFQEAGYADSCVSTFVGTSSFEFFILGDVFMRKFYTVFDMGENQVGFATAAPAPGHAVVVLPTDSGVTPFTDQPSPPSSGSDVITLSWAIMCLVVVMCTKL